MLMWVIFVGTPNVIGKEKVSRPDLINNTCHANTTLYWMALKTGLYCKAGQVSDCVVYLYRMMLQNTKKIYHNFDVFLFQ